MNPDTNTSAPEQATHEHNHDHGHAHSHDHSHDHGPKKNVLMAVLAYFGPLIIISYIFAKDDPFVKFHIKQGLVLLIIQAILWIVGWYMLFFIWPIIRLVRLAVGILAIIGIIRAIQGEEKALPIVGEWGRHFKI